MSLHDAVQGFCGLSLGLLLSSCTSDNPASDEPGCLAMAGSTDCTALYEPTFDNVFKYTLSRTCAATGCHREPNPRADMALDEIEMAFTNLRADSPSGEPRIIPRDVKCGKLIVRLETKGATYSMPPPPARLSDLELCSIRQWDANGAER